MTGGRHVSRRLRQNCGIAPHPVDGLADATDRLIHGHRHLTQFAVPGIRQSSRQIASRHRLHAGHARMDWHSDAASDVHDQQHRHQQRGHRQPQCLSPIPLELRDPGRQQLVEFRDRAIPQIEAGIAGSQTGFLELVGSGRLRLGLRHLLEQFQERTGFGLVAIQERLQVSFERLAFAEEVRVLGERCPRAGGDADEIGFIEQTGIDPQLHALLDRQLLVLQGAIAVADDRRQAVLSLRQRDQRAVHQIEAVEVRIEDQVRRIPRMRDHGADVGDHARVLDIAGLGGE